MQNTTLSAAQSAYQNLIGPLSAAFGPNKSEFNRELLPRLEGFPEYTLKNAANHLIETCKYRPKIAEIIEACKRGKTYSGPGVGIPHFEAVSYIEKANEAMKSPHGKQAVREGWAIDYWLFVRDNGDEKITQEQVIKFRDGLITGRIAAEKLNTSEYEDNICAPMLRKLWRSMQSREQELGSMAA